MEFERNWRADVLPAPPMIAPMRSYVWPIAIAGEEDALARGAVYVMVKPSAGASYLLTCALGFKDPAMPRGIFACPDADWICVVAGGYAYLADVNRPDSVTLLPGKPVVEVVSAVQEGLLLFVGFQAVTAWSREGKAWETGRLSWEGLRVTGIDGGFLKGLGWDLMKDVEVEFSVNLETGEHTGGGWRR